MTIVPNGRLRASAIEIVLGDGGAEYAASGLMVKSKVTIATICNAETVFRIAETGIRNIVISVRCWVAAFKQDDGNRAVATG